ncbi:O-antigen ligase family protein [Herbaspirillum lusitanum]|uniref:O-antigen ligase family protein n=1 Tax=Herbaspirillum lusitanum TaxID=213312 RepID=A0ABW9A9P7_9BURK
MREDVKKIHSPRLVQMHKKFFYFSAGNPSAANREGLTVRVIFQQVIFVLLFLFLSLGMVVNKLAGASFHLLLLASLIGIALGGQQRRKQFWLTLTKFWPLHLAMAGMALAVFANHLSLGGGSVKEYNFPLRFFAFTFLFWLFLQMELVQMRRLRWAFALGAIIMMVRTYYMTQGGASREYSNFMPIIAFTELAALLGCLGVLSIHWDRLRANWRFYGRTLFQVFAGIAGLYAVYLYQSRGAWFAIPVFVIAGCALLSPKRSYSRMLIGVLILASITLIYGATETVQQRLQQAESDLRGLAAGQADTSIGIRFQLWKGAWILLKEHPWAGVGSEGFAGALRDLAERKILSPSSIALPHAHNEFLFTGAVYGSIGLIALLALYLVPLIYFVRFLWVDDKAQKATAMMGVVLVCAFIANGLVDVMFLWRECAIFYGVVLSFLMACAAKERQLVPLAQLP